MSHFNKVSLDEAQAAKNDLAKKLLKHFSTASGGLINGVGIGRISTAEYCVQVGLLREPTDAEKEDLPDAHMGVKVRYVHTGPAKARIKAR